MYHVTGALPLHNFRDSWFISKQICYVFDIKGDYHKKITWFNGSAATGVFLCFSNSVENYQCK